MKAGTTGWTILVSNPLPSPQHSPLNCTAATMLLFSLSFLSCECVGFGSVEQWSRLEAEVEVVYERDVTVVEAVGGRGIGS